MVIAIGMMVDASIVVIESIFRSQEKGLERKEAAFQGTKEVTMSIVASTITTVVVYVPLALLEGLSGQLFYQLGFTIVFSMLTSLIAALMLVPLFFMMFKPVEKEGLPVDRLLKKFSDKYQVFMKKILYRKKSVLAFSVALLIAAFAIASTLNMEMIPTADEGMVQVTVNFRAGTTLEVQDNVMQEWERIAEEHEDVIGYSVSIGSSSALTASGATLTASLNPDRNMSTLEVVDEWNELAKSMTNVDITVSSSGSSMSALMTTGSYEIDLQSYDMAALRKAADELAAAMRGVEGVVKAEHSLSNATTLVKVDVDPLKAMQYCLTPIQVAMNLNNVLSGVNPVNLTKDGSEYEVWLEYPEGTYDDLNKVMDLTIPTSFGTVVPLRDIAELIYTEGQESIEKQDGIYYEAVTETTTSDLRFEAQDAIDALVEKMDFPEGVTPANSMQVDMMYEELISLLKSIFTAVFLVFLVMAMQFESVRFSLMVMTCIPFSLIGSFLLLFVTGSNISMISLMGFLMLMGIVVNNGILFVDSTNQFREEMPLEDALIQSGVIRLRPILMTTLTTILSMVPLGLGIGTNAVMMQGMALVIIGGLIASKILTLILIPTFYLILYKKVIVREF